MTGVRAWILAVLLLLAWAAIPDGPNAPTLPACPEDSVLVGLGAFDSGRWTAYQCGPAVDDYREA